MLVTSITDGSAKIVISDAISIAHRKSGMRASVMPGGRILRMVATMLTDAAQRGDLGEGDHLRPDVGAVARASRPGPTAAGIRTSRGPA